jgi:hypothetical protein
VEHTYSWSELAISLYEKLTEQNAEICYEANKLKVYVPSGVGFDAKHAVWMFDGILKIRTKNIENESA